MTPRIGVTDHAVVRWLERVKGLDVVAARSAIVAACADAMNAGALQLHRPEGTYVLQPDTRTVVTILAPGMKEGIRQRVSNQARHRRMGKR